ncbi:hypothetical protein GCM10010254_57150 [Streptomyces chromofuscus]|nr:hypothetical protein GCM10010254_57150 [Streptomyces chromofuscus]
MFTGRRLVAEDGTPVATRCFPREAQSVAVARQFVHLALVELKLPDLADWAELITSELASNAVRHARHDSFRVTVRRLGATRVRVAVIDKSRDLPELVAPCDDDEHGRGLALVDAFSAQWGTDPLNWGKRVWADLESPGLEETPAPNVPIYTHRGAQVIYVLIVVAVTALITAGVAAQH